jgi:hypothetical protein
MMGEAHWAYAEFLEAEGGQWVLDTGTPGWVARVYFRDYAPQDGPFSVTSKRHLGLDGASLDEWDDRPWALTISRSSPRDGWGWRYWDLSQ